MLPPPPPPPPPAGAGTSDSIPNPGDPLSVSILTEKHVVIVHDMIQHMEGNEIYAPLFRELSPIEKKNCKQMTGRKPKSLTWVEGKIRELNERLSNTTLDVSTFENLPFGGMVLKLVETIQLIAEDYKHFTDKFSAKHRAAQNFLARFEHQYKRKLRKHLDVRPSDMKCATCALSRNPKKGTPIECSQCYIWYHLSCADTPQRFEPWICANCFRANSESRDRPQQFAPHAMNPMNGGGHVATLSQRADRYGISADLQKIRNRVSSFFKKVTTLNQDRLVGLCEDHMRQLDLAKEEAEEQVKQAREKEKKASADLAEKNAEIQQMKEDRTKVEEEMVRLKKEIERLAEENKELQNKLEMEEQKVEKLQGSVDSLSAKPKGKKTKVSTRKIVDEATEEMAESSAPSATQVSDHGKSIPNPLESPETIPVIDLDEELFEDDDEEMNESGAPPTVTSGSDSPERDTEASPEKVEKNLVQAQSVTKAEAKVPDSTLKLHDANDEEGNIDQDTMETEPEETKDSKSEAKKGKSENETDNPAKTDEKNEENKTNKDIEASNDEKVGKQGLQKASKEVKEGKPDSDDEVKKFFNDADHADLNVGVPSAEVHNIFGLSGNTLPDQYDGYVPDLGARNEESGGGQNSDLSCGNEKFTGTEKDMKDIDSDQSEGDAQSEKSEKEGEKKENSKKKKIKKKADKVSKTQNKPRMKKGYQILRDSPDEDSEQEEETGQDDKSKNKEDAGNSDNSYWDDMIYRGRKRIQPKRWKPEDYVEERRRRSRLNPDKLFLPPNRLSVKRQRPDGDSSAGNTSVSNAANKRRRKRRPRPWRGSQKRRQLRRREKDSRAARSRSADEGKVSSAEEKKKDRRKRRNAEKPEYKEDEGNDNIPEGEYEVDTILDMRIDPKNGGREYLVKWKGYGDDENTWERDENMQCPLILAAFLKKRGLKNKIDK